jgi:hypothetical protein
MKSALSIIIIALATSLTGTAQAQTPSSKVERAESKADKQQPAAKAKCSNIADPEKKKACRKEAKAQAKIKQHQQATQNSSSK